LAVSLLLALAFSACSTDSPTAPQQPQTQVPTSSPAATAWNIQVTITPDRVEISGVPVDVLVSVLALQASNGQPPPDGAAIVLTTTFGSFVTTGAGGVEVLARSLVANTVNGRVSAFLRFDGQATGTAVVQAQLEQSFAQGVVEVASPPPPPAPVPPPPFFISEVQPDAGEPTGGQVRILGSGFDPPFRVLFGANPAVVRSHSDSSLTVDVPPVTLEPGQTLTVPVTVTINFNDTDPEQPTQTDSLPNAFTYARGAGGGEILIPKIFSINPTSGPNEGGTEVVIRGEGFSDEVQVFFSSGSLVEVNLLQVSRDRLVIRTPAATGSNSINLNSIVDVRVLNADTGFEDVLAGGFQYGDGQGGASVQITSAGPTEGPYTGGDVVTIFGQGFEEPVAVEFGGAGQEKISVTGTEIIARSVRVQIEGCSEVSGPFRVTNIETGESAEALTWIYRVFDPIVNSITPSSVRTDENGNILPGEPTTVTIGGSQFDPPVAVEIDGRLAFNATLDPTGTLITAEIPPFVGDFDSEDCDDDGDGNSGRRLLPAAVDVRVENLPSECFIELTERFVYVPPATCIDDAGPPPPPSPPLITGVTPPSGSESGGTMVTISGQNFDTSVLVEIGGNLASAVTRVSSTTITATTPAFTGTFNTVACDDDMDGTAGTRIVSTTVPVVVTNLTTGLSDTRQAFTYDPDAAPPPCVGD